MVRLTVSMSHGLSLAIDDEARLLVQGSTVGERFKGLVPAALDALLRLNDEDGDDDVSRLEQVAVEHGGVLAGPQVEHVLQRMVGLGLLSVTIWDAHGPLVRLNPASPRHLEPGVHKLNTAGDRRVVLSRFVLLRREESRAVAESPLSTLRLALLGPRAEALLVALMTERPLAKLADATPSIAPDALALLLNIMIDAQMITNVRQTGVAEEDDDSRLKPWQFHDLLFHSRSRFGRHVGGYGGTYRLQSAIEPLPALKERMTSDVIPLARPAIGNGDRAGLSLADCMQRRRSISEHGDPPISLSQLESFLFQVARVRAVYKSRLEELSDRDYPGGGACYELEIYPCVSRCSGLAPGLYQYRPQAHELCRLREADVATDSLLDFARLAAQSPSKPQVLLIIAARFARVTWKYESVAYALILKDVGVLLEAMYLVATAEGLAPRALGGGDADAFARASSLDYFCEGAVGEFMLGSLPAGGAS
jgi:oxazoline/thiazoline dehydrogenase